MRRWSILLVLLAIGAAPPSAPERPLILALGDSLTAGYGLDQGLGVSPQLQGALRRHGVKATVIDAGVSGDTSSGGRQRLKWVLSSAPAKPDLVIVEFGANDMLRGVDPAITRVNLDAILTELGRREIRTVLAGMRAPPNYDSAYIVRFEAIYPELARKHGATLIPFFLEGVAGQKDMLQADGMHPTFGGVKRIVTGILPAVKQALAGR